MCFTGLTILSSVNPLNATQLITTPFKCVSMTNQESKVRPQMFNVNSDENVFYHFSIKLHYSILYHFSSKYSGSCNNNNDPYAKIWVPDIVKNWC